MKRRKFIKNSALCVGAASLSPSLLVGEDVGSVPSYLRGYESLYAENPRKAAIEYFQDARFGLFIHYGLYSLYKGFYKGKHSKPAEWVQFRGVIPIEEYAKKADEFTAAKFDADFITDMALDAGMKYINLTTRHHDSFCLFDSKHTEFKSTNSAAKRDLVAELSEQCQQKGLGFYLYYSHGRDWRHPHAPNNDEFPKGAARPKYKQRPSIYASKEDYDLNIYLQFMKDQVTELLTNYGPIGAIWLDGISVPASRMEKDGDVMKCQELFDHVHSLQPQVLVSYKQGLLGTEDFKAPERHFRGESDVPLEICDTLQGYSWGYDRNDEGEHRSPDQVMEKLEQAKSMNANLLLNTGPKPNGSIHEDDVATLKVVGKRFRARC